MALPSGKWRGRVRPVPSLSANKFVLTVVALLAMGFVWGMIFGYV